MSEETQDKDQIIASLIESVECMREELSRVRNSNRILRRVHSALRSANASLRAAYELAQENDLLFQRFCDREFDFDAKVALPEEGGLLNSGT